MRRNGSGRERVNGNSGNEVTSGKCKHKLQLRGDGKKGSTELGRRVNKAEEVMEKHKLEYENNKCRAK